MVMIQLGCQERDRHAEEISRLDHQLIEAFGHLKQSLVANSDLSKRLDSEVAEKEKAQHEVAEAGRCLAEVEAEMARVVAENTQLKKMVEERDKKISSLATELTTLKAAKDEAEAELGHNFDHTDKLLKQSFLRAVRQAHVLYGGSPTSGAFDLDHKVYQGQIMPIAEIKALVKKQVGSTEGKGDEDNED